MIIKACKMNKCPEIFNELTILILQRITNIKTIGNSNYHENSIENQNNDK